MFFNRNQTGGVNWILVGLGNPGSKYESTRHNMGWLALDSLMEKESFKLTKLRFKAWTGILERNGNKILVMKPQTYMNLSGIPRCGPPAPRRPRPAQRSTARCPARSCG